MKNIFITLMLLAILTPISQASTLQEIIDKFRARVNEIDTSQSSAEDTTVKIWANMAYHKTSKLGGFIEKRQDYYFGRDTAQYVLPSDFRNIKGIMYNSQYKAEWQTIFNNPLMAQPDTNVMQYAISRVDKDTAEIHLRFGVVGNSETDILYNEDSLKYLLPDDYLKMIQAVVISEGGMFQESVLNPFFFADTNVNSYFDYKRDDDSSWLYFKGGSVADDDTIRVFYQRTAIDGDSIRVLYYGSATDMVAVSDTTDITEDMEVFIIDEMIAYYELYLDDFQAYLNLIQMNRQDMGIEKGVRENAPPTQ